MNDFKNRSPYIELCLCRRCASVYYDDPTYWIERAEIFQDELHKPYLVELLGWLQDMNWPGAFCILNRLQRYADNNSLRDAINICIEKARKCRNEVWEGNLCLLLHKH